MLTQIHQSCVKELRDSKFYFFLAMVESALAETGKRRLTILAGVLSQLIFQQASTLHGQIFS